MTTSYRSLTLLSVAVFALLSYNFMSASWTAPTGTPPANNTPAPVNVGSTTQAKTGNLSANIFAATTEMRSNRYCDALGGNCFTATSTGGGGNEVVYLETPRQIFGPETFQSTADVRRSYNLLTGGYPTNMIRAYVTVNGKGNPDTSYQTGGDDRQTVSVDGLKPWVSYFPPFTTAPSPIATFGALEERKGEWIPVKDNVIDFVANCQHAGCGNPGTYSDGRVWARPYPSLTIEISGYECAGPCSGSGTAASCTLNLSWNINGKTGSTVRTVYGTGQMALGMNYDKDDWEWFPNIGDTYTEPLDSHGWGGSSTDSSERAIVGYYDARHYQRDRTILTGYDAYNHIVITPLLMSNGSTVTITNQAVPDIPAGTISLTGTISNCRQ